MSQTQITADNLRAAKALIDNALTRCYLISIEGGAQRSGDRASIIDSLGKVDCDCMTFWSGDGGYMGGVKLDWGTERLFCAIHAHHRIESMIFYIRNAA